MSENIKQEIPVKINYDNNKNHNHNNNWNHNQNQNKNNLNQKKSMKYDYKLYFFITLWLLVITFIYFSTSKTPENLAKSVYDENQKTYNQLQNIKHILETWSWIIQKK